MFEYDTPNQIALEPTWISVLSMPKRNKWTYKKHNFIKAHEARKPRQPLSFLIEKAVDLLTLFLNLLVRL